MGQKQRLRAARNEYRGRNGEILVNEREPEEDATVIELEDDTGHAGAPAEAHPEPQEDDDEPLAVLKRQFDELQIERDAQARRAAELEVRNREHEATLAKRDGSELENHKAVLSQAYNTEELKKADAKRRAAEALRSGDFDAAAEAQDDMAKSHAVMMQYASAYQQIEAQEKAPKPVRQEPAGDQFEAALTKMHPKVAQWARDHRDDVINPDRQKLAIAADQVALARGYAPGSDDYIDTLDEMMGYGVLENGTATQKKPAQPRQAATVQTSRRAVAAPSSRTGGSSSGGRRSVILTEDDKRQAQGYGVPLEEYAKWKLNAEKVVNIQDNSNRLHMKVVAE
jgi:hypothetical protein